MQSPQVTNDGPGKEPLPARLQRVSADVEGLQGVHGALLVLIQGDLVGALQVNDGRAEFVPGATEGAAVAEFDDPDDIGRLMRGELNPVVASLQRRLSLRGDLSLGARIILGLRTGAMFVPIESKKA